MAAKRHFNLERARIRLEMACLALEVARDLYQRLCEAPMAVPARELFLARSEVQRLSLEADIVALDLAEEEEGVNNGR